MCIWKKGESLGTENHIRWSEFSIMSVRAKFYSVIIIARDVRLKLELTRLLSLP